ncbi:HIT-like protein [Irpex rosettiformis]|uniref:HIT-like protein n=1 Tax=Irpex rosettiformis TaxID=378272 RepID=A0ACB8TX49_9APHY|nr:HIT-like protein [Irpex rosettiformis]
MTSFIIKAHEGRTVPKSWQSYPRQSCAFCRILRGEGPAFKIFENELVVAILDIQPLRRGHTLIIPKTHVSRVSELPEEFAAAVGIATTKVSNALAQALDNTGLNIVCNQEYAQAVPHVHYHIIPAPDFTNPKPQQAAVQDQRTTVFTRKEMHKAEFESRDDLDDDEARELASKIRARL